MKGRSNRLPPSAPFEDWGDGQWTVDCSCGVTFDDGEEMVSCDVCGVWVHTRCSRFVRGESSFACHKCKAAASNVSHDTEETEVAQFLVELPTKTDRCTSPIPSAGAPYRSPFRLWGHVPMEERVHVQGVPGGDPSLFDGLSSSAFSSGLWKCTGYVPKKFNFKYKEFPCWDEEIKDSRGADEQFSLSKETTVQVSPHGSMKKDDQSLLSSANPFGWVKKERNKLRVSGSHSGKGRKEESAEEREACGKKRERGDSVATVIGVKERAYPGIIFNSKKEDLSENRPPQIVENDIKKAIRVYKRGAVLPKPNYKNLDGPKENGCITKQTLDFKTSERDLSDEVLRSKLPLEHHVKVEKVDVLDTNTSFAACRGEGSNTADDDIRHEDFLKAFNGFKGPKNQVHVDNSSSGCSTGGSVESKKMRAANFGHGTQQNVADIALVSFAPSSHSTRNEEIEVKIEATGFPIFENTKLPTCQFSDGKLGVMHDVPQHQNLQDTLSVVLDESDTVMGLPLKELKSKIAQKELCQSNQEFINSADRDLKLPSMKSSGAYLSHSAAAIEMVADIEKTSSTQKAPIVSKLSVTSNDKSSTPSTSVLTGKAVHVIKQERVKVTTASNGKRDNTTNNTSVEESVQIVHHKGVHSIISKSSQAERIPHFSVSKHSSLDLDKQLTFPPLQTSAETQETPSGTAEVTGSSILQNQSAQPKQKLPGSSQKNDKTTHPTTQAASKILSHSLLMHTSASTNAASTLSDEELALLLHQELNSSPRVHRVPRLRQTTGMNFATSSATNILPKRSCSGGRDQVSVFRRRHKDDSSKTSSRALDVIDESQIMSKSSSEPKQQESALSDDDITEKSKRGGSADNATSSKNNASGTIGCVNCSATSFDKRESNLPANVDECSTLFALNLPGLIDEIMSKGKCSTYEELCDLVRPYWHSLRKPNGERYAYSSHSQAVLDCLRNRSEWAHLIDRVPKTNASKKRRKLDSETPAMDYENEEVKSFPNFKWVEVKRRSLKGAKSSRKIQPRHSDDDPARSSHSINEGSACRASDDDSDAVAYSSSSDYSN